MLGISTKTAEFEAMKSDIFFYIARLDSKDLSFQSKLRLTKILIINNCFIFNRKPLNETGINNLDLNKKSALEILSIFAYLTISISL